MTSIILYRAKFNGDNPVINGREIELPRDVAFEADASLIDVLDRAGVPYDAAPATGATTGNIIITKPSPYGDYVPLSINGRLTRLLAGVALSLSAGELAVLDAANVPYTQERSNGPVLTPGAITLGTIPAINQDRVYQRLTKTGGGQGKGVGVVLDLPISVSTPGTIAVRVVDADTPSTILQSGLSVTVTEGQTVLHVPGVDARLGWFFLELETSAGVWTRMSRKCGMGLLFAFTGQSLMAGLISKADTNSIASTGVSIPTNGRIWASADVATTPTAWRSPSESSAGSNLANAAGSCELMNRLIQLAGVNVGLIGVAIGNTKVFQWVPGQTNGDALTSAIASAGGSFEIFYHFIGHSDARDATPYNLWQADVNTMWAAINANNLVVPHVFATAIPNINAGLAWGNVQSQECIRLASADWAVSKGGQPVLMWDISLVDGVHQDQAGGVRIARHIYRALRPAFGQTHDDKGITFGVPTISGVDVFLPATLPSGATTVNLTGLTAPLFGMWPGANRGSQYTKDTTTPIAWDAGNSRFILKLNGDPGAVPIQILPFAGPAQSNDGTANMIFDDLIDADGIAYGRLPYAHPRAIKLYQPGTRDLTPSSVAYASGRFSNTLSAGFAQMQRFPFPGMGTGFTLEFWFWSDVVDGTTRYFFGSNSIRAGITNDDFQCTLGSGATFNLNNVIVQGQWHHVAICVYGNATTGLLYFDGILSGTPAISGFNPNPNVVDQFSVRQFAANAATRLINNTQLIDEIAIWEGVKYPANFVPPSAPYVGNEANLQMLWHLEGDTLNSAA